MQLDDSVERMKGVGPKTAALFEKIKVYTIEDLLRLYPRNYLSYDPPVDIEEAEVGQRVAIRAQIQSYVDVKRVGKHKIVTCTVKDLTGSVRLTWFNSPFLKQVFHIGQTFIFVGVLSQRKFQLTMEHPEYYSVDQYQKMVSTLQPVYPLTEGLSNKVVTKTIQNALNVVELLQDKVPQSIQQSYSLMPIEQAVEGVHFPQSIEQLSNCRNRLVFDEFFLFLVHMRQMREKTIQVENAFEIKDFTGANAFIKSLPFELTNGQRKAVDDIFRDFAGKTVMNRLVQGDVGSGKTAVAQIALLTVAQNGYQGALMAPTEVLATQHYQDLKRDFEPLGIQVALLCGSTKISQKRKIYEQLLNGDIDIIVGTHALIQDKVVYKNLALVVTDEQHRFGVRQREKLSEKGNEPHVLVMSATPIPRTLAIIMYGDLDISVICDMPASRKPIKNCVVGPRYRPTAYKFMQQQINEGHQIYIICPMVEASETVEAENVIEYREELLSYFADDVEIAYLHGKMTPDEKNVIMQAFVEKKIDILVSTTVIEVGINNPNATVMMIENAEKFGLAQLHQLRGRVGRGSAQSYCIMLCTTQKQEAFDRLNILNTSNDGFFIANEDLKMRGPGDFFGVRQSGEMLFHLGDIYNHAEILKNARDAVTMLEKENFDFDVFEETKGIIL